MIPASLTFLEALRFSRTVATGLDVVYDGEIVLDDVLITGGTVTTDRGSNTRYTATVDIALNTWDQVPVDTDGTRIRIYTGLESIGRTEMLQVGEYQVYDYKRTKRGAISVTLKGLENLVIEDQFLVPRTPPYGASTIDTIINLIIESVPDAVFQIDCTYDKTITATGAWDKERWKAVNQLADSIYAEVYCGHDGRWYIVDIPDMTNLRPVFYVSTGPDGVLIEQSYGNTRNGRWNATSVSGQSSDSTIPALWARAVDDDPLSKTFYGGPWGKVTRFYSSQFFTKQSQLQDYADLLLLQGLAPRWDMSISATPLPMLEAGDAVGTTNPDDSTNSTGPTFLLQQTTLALTTAAWNAVVFSDTTDPAEDSL